MLQPLPVPTEAWQIVSMDFIEGLRKSKHFYTILIVMNKFTKYAHFIPLSHSYTAMSIAHLYFTHIYKLRDLPQTIIFDRDRLFTSNFWQELFRLSQTTLNMSSSYPHKLMAKLNPLRCMVHYVPNKWSEWLALAEFGYNTTTHSTHGKTPFQVLYGHPPRHFGISDTP